MLASIWSLVGLVCADGAVVSYDAQPERAASATAEAASIERIASHRWSFACGLTVGTVALLKRLASPAPGA